MIISFYTVIGWVDQYLFSIRNRGLAGNIMKDKTVQNEGDDFCTWTGEGHQLAFCGNQDAYRLEVRKFEGNDRTVVMSESDSTKFNQVMMYFLTQEA